MINLMEKDLGVWELVSLSQLSEQVAGVNECQLDRGEGGLRSEGVWNCMQWRWTVGKELRVVLECQALMNGGSISSYKTIRRSGVGKCLALDGLPFRSIPRKWAVWIFCTGFWKGK